MLSKKARRESKEEPLKIFNVHGFVRCKNVLICVQQDATLHSLFYLKTALHDSGGNSTHHQERKKLYLQHLVFVTPLLVSAATVADSIYRLEHITHQGV
jgi:hypothetical protein